ncbi:MAG: hypothetical protein U1F68_12995 [Gammaproteobacteria bacterium]
MFFDATTLASLAAFLTRFEHPCILCAPMLGRTLAASGRRVTVLDIDERFADIPGFRVWNIHRPQRLDERFDIIVCDPPFFKVSLSRLFSAIRVLAQHRFEQPLLIAYLRRREAALKSTFQRFGLEATGFLPRYLTVQMVERNEIELFGNLGPEAHAALRG